MWNDLVGFWDKERRELVCLFPPGTGSNSVAKRETVGLIIIETDTKSVVFPVFRNGGSWLHTCLYIPPETMVFKIKALDITADELASNLRVQQRTRQSTGPHGRSKLTGIRELTYSTPIDDFPTSNGGSASKPEAPRLNADSPVLCVSMDASGSRIDLDVLLKSHRSKPAHSAHSERLLFYVPTLETPSNDAPSVFGPAALLEPNFVVNHANDGKNADVQRLSVQFPEAMDTRAGHFPIPFLRVLHYSMAAAQASRDESERLRDGRSGGLYDAPYRLQNAYPQPGRMETWLEESPILGSLELNLKNVEIGDVIWVRVVQPGSMERFIWRQEGHLSVDAGLANSQFRASHDKWQSVPKFMDSVIQDQAPGSQKGVPYYNRLADALSDMKPTESTPCVWTSWEQQHSAISFPRIRGVTPSPAALFVAQEFVQTLPDGLRGDSSGGRALSIPDHMPLAMAVAMGPSFLRDANLVDSINRTLRDAIDNESDVSYRHSPAALLYKSHERISQLDRDDQLALIELIDRSELVQAGLLVHLLSAHSDIDRAAGRRAISALEIAFLSEKEWASNRYDDMSAEAIWVEFDTNRDLRERVANSRPLRDILWAELLYNESNERTETIAHEIWQFVFEDSTVNQASADDMRKFYSWLQRAFDWVEREFMDAISALKSGFPSSTDLVSRRFSLIDKTLWREIFEVDPVDVGYESAPNSARIQSGDFLSDDDSGAANSINAYLDAATDPLNRVQMAAILYFYCVEQKISRYSDFISQAVDSWKSTQSFGQIARDNADEKVAKYLSEHLHREQGAGSIGPTDDQLNAALLALEDAKRTATGAGIERVAPSTLLAVWAIEKETLSNMSFSLAERARLHFLSQTRPGDFLEERAVLSAERALSD